MSGCEIIFMNVVDKTSGHVKGNELLSTESYDEEVEDCAAW